MKELAKVEKDLGADGGKVSAQLGVEGAELKALVAVSYPIAKVVEPAMKGVDGLLDKLKALIPGDWDDAMIEKFKGEYKADLVKMLSE